MMDRSGEQGGTPHLARWTREGFVGDSTSIIRPHHTPDFLSVEGPHAPHRLRIEELPLADRRDPAALPAPFLAARDGMKLSASGREAPMPFVVCNVEADELYFVQEGVLEFATDHGTITGAAGDFVCIPRAVPHRVRPLATPTLSVIMEIPGAVSLDPAALSGLAAERPAIDAPTPSGGETVVLVKAFDGITRYVKPHDPLAAVALVSGTVPVWKLNLKDIPCHSPAGDGPPGPFVSAPNMDVLVYNLSARPRRRPPIHQNADYDEVIYYFAGPGAWGRVSDPGTLTWVPKGLVHHGPPEDVPEGYLAWLLDSRATLRLTPVGLAAAELMETGMYGRHPAHGGARALSPATAG